MQIADVFLSPLAQKFLSHLGAGEEGNVEVEWKRQEKVSPL